MNQNSDQCLTSSMALPEELKQRSADRPFSLSKFILLAILSLLFISCGSNSTGTNGSGDGNNGGDDPPTEPTFANVQDIFNSSCGGSNCHINNRQSGVQLDSYDNVINSEGVQYGGKVVVPDEPENSPLVDKIEPNPEFGERMPRNGSPLSDDQISLIREWISEGAQNN